MIHEETKENNNGYVAPASAPNVADVADAASKATKKKKPKDIGELEGCVKIQMVEPPPEAPMAKATFKKMSKQILDVIKEVDDPPARELNFGPGPPKATMQNVVEALKHTPQGSKIVRGWRLVHVKNGKREDPDEFLRVSDAWKAVFHCVVEMPPQKGSKGTYYDPSSTVYEGYGKGIFVPSSRAHAELTDDELFTASWIFGSVYGGSPVFCDFVVRQIKVRGGRKGLVSISPHDLVAERQVSISAYPYFLEWHHESKCLIDPDTLGEFWGWDTLDVDAESDEKPAPSRFALFSQKGFKGLQRRLQERVDRDGIDEDGIRRAFFQTYDMYHSSLNLLLQTKVEESIRESPYALEVERR